MSDPVVLINSFEVPIMDAESFITAWEKVRDYLQTQPGYLDTTLPPRGAPASAWRPRASPGTARTRPCTAPREPKRPQRRARPQAR